jgi:hypothetical protein
MSGGEGEMESTGGLTTWVILGVIFGGAAALYGWLFWAKSRAFWQAMVRLRDRIDRSKRW